MMEFEFNDVGVCVNPNILEREVGRGGSFYVRTALTDKGWVYGSGVSLPDRGYSTPCWKSDITFKHERDAIKAGLEKVVRYADSQKYCSSSVKKAAIAVTFEAKREIYKHSYIELNLFDL